MKKYFMLTALLITVSFYLAAQTPPSIAWQKTLGGSNSDAAYSIEQTLDGGYITAGESYSADGDVSDNHGNSDWWIVKFDGSGVIQWEKSLGGSDYEAARSVKQTSDGGYILAGYTLSNDGDVSGNHFGYGDVWVVKLNSSGDIQWQKCLGGSSVEEAFSIAQTSDGGYIVGGATDSNDGDVSGNHDLTGVEPDAWIVKLNSGGSIEWQKCLGGSNWEDAYSVEQTADGGYIMGGDVNSTDGDVSGNKGGYDYWIVKLNGNGDIQWQKCLGGSGYEAGANSVEQTTDGGYIAAGLSDSNDGDVTGNHGLYDYWIVKLNSSGTIQWQKSLGGSDYDAAVSIKQTSDGGYITGGNSSSTDGDITGNHGFYDFGVIKLNSSGTIQWQKSLGGSDYDYLGSIRQTSDGGYITAGYSTSNDGDVTGNHGSTDYWIVKLEPDPLLPVTLLNFSGEIQGKQNLLHWSTATEHNNTGFEVQHGSDGYNFNKIGFANTKAINGNSNAKLHYDFIDGSYTASTNYYRLKQIDKDGKFTYSNIVVLKDDNGIAAGAPIIYPNPVKDILNVKIPSSNNNQVTLLLTDLSGRLLRNKVTQVGTGESIIQIDVSHLAAGTYFLKIVCSDGCANAVQKFIKE